MNEREKGKNHKRNLFSARVVSVQFLCAEESRKRNAAKVREGATEGGGGRGGSVRISCGSSVVGELSGPTAALESSGSKTCVALGAARPRPLQIQRLLMELPILQLCHSR